jgi:uncharacterized protein YbjT (DUF2867 family)
MNILVTGATGNVGSAVVNHYNGNDTLFIAQRDGDVPKSNGMFFDFDDPNRTADTLKRVDVLFLMRPPHISDVNRFFAPIVTACKAGGVKHIVFLSVQGAEQASVIPHAKIEKLISASGVPYTFLRPSYFMQNLTGALRDGIRLRDEIVLPSGNAKFLWVDTDDIGRCAGRVLEDPDAHENRACPITGSDLLSFGEVAKLLSLELNREIRFEPINPARFYFRKRKEGMPSGFALVMTLLHTLPRVQPAPQMSSEYEAVTGLKPTTLVDFIRQNKASWYR